MSNSVKQKGAPTNEKMLKTLIGEYIHVPNNPHKTTTPTGATGTVNAWFAGKVAGYEKAFVAFNYEANEFYDKPKTFFQVLLCDGMGYVLSDKAEIEVITEEDFMVLVAEFDAKKALEEKAKAGEPSGLLLPESAKGSIILPDNEIVKSSSRGSRVVEFPGGTR